jgi:hypothetical protein
MEPVVGILLLTIDRWPVTCRPEIGYRQWSMPFVKGFRPTLQSAASVENGARMDLLLTIDRCYMLPEIASGQRLEGFQADAAECSSVENGARGRILLLTIDRWPVICYRLSPVVNAT